MFVITNLIKPWMGKLILNHLIGNNFPEFHIRLLGSYFFKLTLGSDCLELCFWTVDFKTILILNLTPKLSFKPRFRMLIIIVYYKKSERLLSLDSWFVFYDEEKSCSKSCSIEKFYCAEAGGLFKVFVTFLLPPGIKGLNISQKHLLRSPLLS